MRFQIGTNVQNFMRKSIKIFADIEKAISWLANDDNEFEALINFVNKIINNDRIPRIR